MARPLILSNGEMHVGINLYGLVHDFYYPYVGLENHAAAQKMRHRVGVWIEGVFSWLDDGSWNIDHDYVHDALIGRTRAQHVGLRVSIEFEDFVDSAQSAFLRNIHVINQADRPREIRLYMHQVFLISNNLGGDTAQYLPGEPAILHYKGHRAFVVGGTHCKQPRPFNEFSIGLYGIEGHEGTFRDAEDGQLSGNAVEHGRVDSVISFHLDLGAHDSARVNYWIAAGKSPHEALLIHRRIQQEGLLHRLLLTHQSWQQWLEPAERFITKVPDESKDVFRKNILLIKAHADKRGAVIASTDTTMLNYSRDAYAYCWPRDASFVLWPLLRLGYKDELMQFFQFCRRVLSTDGFLMHKYQADGAIGSSWHPYVYAGRPEPPIQEDETAIVLFMFGQYYTMHSDERLLRDYYPTFVRPMADFLAGYIDKTTGLPHPSYDLWEEQFSTSTYTTAVVHAALLVAVKLAEAAEANDDAVRWQSVADDLHTAAQQLYDPALGFFIKGVRRQNHELVRDTTIDLSSFYGAFMFGLFDLKGEEITTSVKTLLRVFASDDAVTCLPRYVHDRYNALSDSAPPNPWFVTTLWLAQYYLEMNQTEKAKPLLAWVREHMMTSGVLAEQVNPYTGHYMSVAPLAWSQAEFVSTMLDVYSQLPQDEDND
ncbi:MAG TPA: glycoside hydrolase family 15 protein [Candidatus Saccharimonadales bacterium]|jgi:GH15 family glucan-1,4-alpha-glucosidase|nr:glycoside hydrolase family 15 protein [Candidatus Saccharimonadales bacterium]